MRVFIYEYTCAKSHCQFDSLRAEGLAMRDVITKDFGRVLGVSVSTIDDAGSNEETYFRELARDSDFTMVIAPEIDKILLTRCRWVLQEQAGAKALLGPSLDAIELTGDKQELASHLTRHSVPTPKVFTRTDVVASGLWILKPRYGVGSIATFRIATADDLHDATQRAREEGFQGDFILQRFVPGIAASVAFIGRAGAMEPLLPCAQLLSGDGRFRYYGGIVPLKAALFERATHLARCAVQAVPGLAGYVGVDLVLGPAADGSMDFVIEINPRLTTSYIGLRALCRFNLAELILRGAQGIDLPELTWEKGAVHYDSRGNVRIR